MRSTLHSGSKNQMTYIELTVSQPKMPSLYMYGEVKMPHHTKMMKLQKGKLSNVPSKCMQSSCLLHIIHSEPHFNHSAVTLTHINQRVSIKIMVKLRPQSDPGHCQ